MRLLVTGGRDFNNQPEVTKLLSKLQPATLIQGGATGADYQAAQAAESLSIEVEEYPAEWSKYGRGAGYIRNKQMLEEGQPDLVVAFPGGKGTGSMIAEAKKAGIPVLLADIDNLDKPEQTNWVGL